MSCCDDKNTFTSIQCEVCDSFFAGMQEKLEAIHGKISSDDFNVEDAGFPSTLTEVCSCVDQLNSFCKGAAIEEPRYLPLVDELSELSKTMEDTRDGVNLEELCNPGIPRPILSPCLRALKLCAIAQGLCLINPLFCPLARLLCLLALIICILFKLLCPKFPKPF